VNFLFNTENKVCIPKHERVCMWEGVHTWWFSSDDDRLAACSIAFWGECSHGHRVFRVWP